MRISDWSSDVCSSDLRSCQAHAAARRERQGGVVFARLFVAIEFLLRVPPCHRRDAARIPAADSVAARARYRMVVGDPARLVIERTPLGELGSRSGRVRGWK